MGKRYNWTETRAKWSVNKSGAKVVKENSREERSSVNKEKKKSHDGYRFLVASQFCFVFVLQTDYFQSATAETSPMLCHVMREGERKQPLFSFPKWLRAERKQLWAERKRGAPRPARRRAGRFSQHRSLVSPSLFMPPFRGNEWRTTVLLWIH